MSRYAWTAAAMDSRTERRQPAMATPRRALQLTTQGRTEQLTPHRDYFACDAPIVRAHPTEFQVTYAPLSPKGRAEARERRKAGHTHAPRYRRARGGA